MLKFHLPVILPEEQMNFKISNIPGNSVYIKYFVIEKDGHTDTVTSDCLKPALVEPISPTGSSVEGETSKTLSFSPTSSSEIDNIFAGDLDELPANRVYSRRGRLITKPIRYRD